MAKKLSRSLTKRSSAAISNDDPVLTEARARHGGGPLEESRGAWARAGSMVISAELEKLQAERIENLLSGNLVIELDPEQVDDVIGSDRRDGWMTDEAFEVLKASIRENGQDVPIQVTPADVSWTPTFSEADGLEFGSVSFEIVSGRRRLEAARELGFKVRAICVRSDDDAALDELHRRFRENVERQNLTLVEELLAIGEMFSHEKTSARKITGRSLAKLLNVAESKVSRARAVYDNRDRLFDEIPDFKDLSLHQLDRLIPALRNGETLPPVDETKSTTNEQKSVSTKGKDKNDAALKRTQIIKGQKIVAKSRKGKITLDLGASAEIDERFLDKLLLFIQTHASSDNS